MGLFVPSNSEPKQPWSQVGSQIQPFLFRLLTNPRPNSSNLSHPECAVQPNYLSLNDRLQQFSIALHHGARVRMHTFQRVFLQKLNRRPESTGLTFKRCNSQDGSSSKVLSDCVSFLDYARRSSKYRLQPDDERNWKLHRPAE